MGRRITAYEFAVFSALDSMTPRPDEIGNLLAMIATTLYNANRGKRQKAIKDWRDFAPWAREPAKPIEGTTEIADKIQSTLMPFVK